MQGTNNILSLQKMISGTVILVLVTLISFAQRDTTRKQVVDITSSYKPSLRNNISKLNITANQLQADTSKLRMKYNIPAQNLFYSYQPVSIRPLAYDQDSIMQLGGYNFVKAGIGNYTTPFISARINLIDNTTAVANVYADYISSKGKIKNQDYSKLNLGAAGSYFIKQHEVYGGISGGVHDFYRYGYDHSLYNYSKSSVLQRFSRFSIFTGARNIAANDLGIDYNPTLKLNLFGLKDRVGESSVTLDIPAEKKINESFRAKLDLNIDYTSYKTKGLSPGNFKVKNTLVQLSPEVIYSKPAFTVHGGIIPVSDNKSFYVLPNIYGEAKLNQVKFILQAGFVGKAIRNNFNGLSEINPYLDSITVLNNTMETELYGGIKSMIGKHFNITAKAGFVYFRNFQLFVNDTTDFKSFHVVNEPTMAAFRIHADVSYVNGEKFSLTSGITINQYSEMKLNKSAWGTLPLELTGAMRYIYSDKIMLKADLYAFAGGPYLLKNNFSKVLAGGFDLSAGGEYKINNKFNAWLDINNIFNDRYQRWYSYPVYGINVLAGVKYKF